jgi:hypothetical protein
MSRPFDPNYDEMTDPELPRIVWSREMGWLNFMDPVTGRWDSIQAEEAPRGWKQIAMRYKNRQRGRPDLRIIRGSRARAPEPEDED